MAEDKKPAAKPKKIADVAQPGESAPSPNSKSVIITHHPTMSDPMMTPESTDTAKTEDTSEGTAIPVARAKHTVLQPLPTSPAPTTEAEPEAEPEKPAEEAAPAEEPVAEPVAEAPEAKPAAKAEDTPPAATEMSSDAKLGAKDVQTDAEIAAAEDAEAERQEKLQELVVSKQYYLPITTSETRRSRQFIAIGVLLSIILIAAWLDIALDASLLHIGNLKAVTNFF